MKIAVHFALVSFNFRGSLSSIMYQFWVQSNLKDVSHLVHFSIFCISGLNHK